MLIISGDWECFTYPDANPVADTRSINILLPSSDLSFSFVFLFFVCLVLFLGGMVTWQCLLKKVHNTKTNFFIDHSSSVVFNNVLPQVINISAYTFSIKLCRCKFHFYISDPFQSTSEYRAWLKFLVLQMKIISLHLSNSSLSWEPICMFISSLFLYYRNSILAMDILSAMTSTSLDYYKFRSYKIR